MGPFGLGLLFAFLAACGQELPTGGSSAAGDGLPEAPRIEVGAAEVRVMTWNVYVGADVDRVLAAESPAEIPALVAEEFQTLIATNFPERADAIARQIEAARPHLIGLQEVSLIRLQENGDAASGGDTPAEAVFLDYLGIIEDALAERGLDYRVGGIVQNVDVEVPMIVDPMGPTFSDVRLTDYDVILVRGDVEVSNVLARNYEAKLPADNLGIEIERGFVAVDARVGEKTYRFVTTHLEPAPIPDLLEVQLRQAQELVDRLVGSPLPVIVVGDFNSPAPAGVTYRFMRAEGYVDVWTRNTLRDDLDGFTNPHSTRLDDVEVKLNRRIDFIFMRNVPGGSNGSTVGPVTAFVVGEEQDDRTSSGLWPSDHAGVIARLQLPPAGGRARCLAMPRA